MDEDTNTTTAEAGASVEPTEVTQVTETTDVAEATPVSAGPSHAELVAEAEQIAATPDEADGKQPDDRKLIDRLKALESQWASAAEDPDEADLRRRFDAARKTHAVARARRAELRAVGRARTGETKRGLLVEAFALARQVDPDKVSVPVAAEPLRREPRRLNRPSPAMFAKKPKPEPEVVEEPTAVEETPVTDVAETAPVAEEAPAVPETPATPAISDDELSAICTQATRLQDEWKAAGFAGKETEDELAPLFRSYLDVIWGAQRKVSSGKISARKDLVREARGLAGRAREAEPAQLTALIREAKALQEKWKAGESAPRGPENTAWQQFSGALREVFSVREKVQGDATAERQEIVAAIAALLNSRDAFRAMKDVGPLLKRWGGAGPVPGKVYAELKAKLDNDLTQIRARADSERKRREAEDDKSQAERAKHASRLVKEAERNRTKSARGSQPQRSAPAGDSALAAAFAAAFGKTEDVAAEVAELEATVATLESRLAVGAHQGDSVVREETGQGFTVSIQVDRSALDPAKINKQLEVARAALARRRADLDAINSKAGELGLR